MKTTNKIFAIMILVISISLTAEAWYCGGCCTGAAYGYSNYATLTWATSAVSYTPSFSTGYVADGGNYVVCPSCTMSISGIGAYYASCECGGATMSANLGTWTYQGSTLKGQAFNGATIPAYQRSQVVNASQTCGAESSSGLYRGNSMTVYTFSTTGAYTVYVDFMKKICFSVDCYNYYWFVNSYPSGGWVAQNSYNIIVPSPSVSAAKSVNNVSAADPSTVYHLSWTVTNNGTGRETVSFARNCGSWSCSFVGYTEGTQVNVSEGGTYTVFMDVTTPSSTGSANVGVTITYDDGYGLSCISAQNTNSLINVTVAAMSPVGAHDSSSCVSSVGWACDGNDYTQALSVHLYLDGPAGGGGAFLGSDNANEVREAAVGAQCGGNVNHGFIYSTPASVSTGLYNSHTIYAYAINIPSGSNPLLSGSPKTVRCGDDAKYNNQGGLPGYPVPSQLYVGQSAYVWVMFMNNGTLNWTAAGDYRIASQSPQDNTVWGLNRLVFPNSTTVTPPTGLSTSFYITAPLTPGNYSFQWRMVKDGSYWFGDYSPNTTIEVVGCPANSLNVVAPTNIFDPSHGIVTLGWNISNNGSRNLSLNITKVCGNARKCNFTGAEVGNNTIIRSLPVYSNVSVYMNASVGNVMSNRVGLNISYDDSEGILCSGVNYVYSEVNVTIPFRT